MNAINKNNTDEENTFDRAERNSAKVKKRL